MLYIDGREIFIHYKDVDGTIKPFKYTPGIKSIDNDFVQNTVQALDAIHFVNKGSTPQTPRSIITQLAYAKNSTVNIFQASESLDNINTGGTTRDVRINWSESAGSLIVNNENAITGGKQSPMTVLAHEIGHAYNILSNPTEYEAMVEQKIPYFSNKEEKRVIEGIETDIASFYNEGIRTNHGGKDYRAISPITTDEACLQIIL